jgi:TRAP-type C4-dicarboxylate transport system permease small subunit
VSHGTEGKLPENARPAGARPVVLATRALNWINTTLLRMSMAGMVLTAVILTYSVVTRYFFKSPTDWQDEASVFLLVGATFFSAAYVQSYRGHVGIEAVSSLLSPAANSVRQLLVDVASALFCAFFSWKSWTLFHEALRDGQTTSSTLAPPLWIPYSMMASGMTLLTIQLLVQVAARVTAGKATQ